MTGLLLPVFVLVCYSLRAEARVNEIHPGVYSFAPDYENPIPYASIFVVTGSGVVAIDCMDVPHSTAFLAAIQEVTDEPVKYLIHTHNHWDHNGGNGVFHEIGAKLMAHAEAAEWMEANPRPEMVTPDTVWNGDREDLVVGNSTFQLLFHGINHGMGMTTVYMPDIKFIYSADLVMPKRVIFAVVPDINMKEWERTLEEILQIDFTTAIWSHSSAEDPLQAGSKQDVVVVLQFLVDLRTAINAELEKGANPFELANKIKLPQYEDWVGYEEFLPMNIWRILMDVLLGPYPWRPTTTQAPPPRTMDPSYNEIYRPLFDRDRKSVV